MLPARRHFVLQRSRLLGRARLPLWGWLPIGRLLPIDVGEGNVSERPIIRGGFPSSKRNRDIHFRANPNGREYVVIDAEEFAFRLLFLHALLHRLEGVG